MAEEYLESEIVFSDSTNESVHKCNHKEIDQLPMNPSNYNSISQFQQQIQHITAPADHSLTDSTLTTSKSFSSNQLNTSNKSLLSHQQQKVVGDNLNSSAPMKIPENYTSTHYYDRRHRRRKQELVNDVYSEDEDEDEDDDDYHQVSIMHNDNTRHPHHQQQRMVPPHVILAKRIAQSVVSSSVHIENGRALRVRARGRSLYQVRDSILRMTGFIES